MHLKAKEVPVILIFSIAMAEIEVTMKAMVAGERGNVEQLLDGMGHEISTELEVNRILECPFLGTLQILVRVQEASWQLGAKRRRFVNM